MAHLTKEPRAAQRLLRHLRNVATLCRMATAALAKRCELTRAQKGYLKRFGAIGLSLGAELRALREHASGNELAPCHGVCGRSLCAHALQTMECHRKLPGSEAAHHAVVVRARAVLDAALASAVAFVRCLAHLLMSVPAALQDVRVLREGASSVDCRQCLGSTIRGQNTRLNSFEGTKLAKSDSQDGVFATVWLSLTRYGFITCAAHFNRMYTSCSYFLLGAENNNFCAPKL